MNIKDIYGNDCPTLYTLSLISGKWRLPILWKIYEFKTIRFNALKKEVYGITNIMLTKCLQEFEKNNVVKRTQYEEIPPRVEYSLTENGVNLLLLLTKLNEWGKNNMSEVYPKSINSH